MGVLMEEELGPSGAVESVSSPADTIEAAPTEEALWGVEVSAAEIIFADKFFGVAEYFERFFAKFFLFFSRTGWLTLGLQP